MPTNLSIILKQECTSLDIFLESEKAIDLYLEDIIFESPFSASQKLVLYNTLHSILLCQFMQSIYPNMKISSQLHQLKLLMYESLGQFNIRIDHSVFYSLKKYVLELSASVGIAVSPGILQSQASLEPQEELIVLNNSLAGVGLTTYINPQLSQLNINATITHITLTKYNSSLRNNPLLHSAVSAAMGIYETDLSPSRLAVQTAIQEMLYLYRKLSEIDTLTLVGIDDIHLESLSYVEKI